MHWWAFGKLGWKAVGSENFNSCHDPWRVCIIILFPISPRVHLLTRHRIIQVVPNVYGVLILGRLVT